MFRATVQDVRTRLLRVRTVIGGVRVTAKLPVMYLAFGHAPRHCHVSIPKSVMLPADSEPLLTLIFDERMNNRRCQ